MSLQKLRLKVSVDVCPTPVPGEVTEGGVIHRLLS